MNFLLSDLPLDLIHDKIGAYLLEDPNKTIHKIFKGKEDDELQILLFGEVKDLTYIDLYDCTNSIDYPMNNKIKNYANYILKVNGVKSTCEKMRIRFYIDTFEMKKKKKIYVYLQNKEGEDIGAITELHYSGAHFKRYTNKYVLYYEQDNECHKQNIQKKNIIQEYKKIETEICLKYF